MPESICPHCGGSGWKIVEREGASGAERCNCRDGERAGLLEERAGIPPLYRHASLDNFKLPADNPTANRGLASVLVALVAVFGGIRTGGGILVAVLAWAVAGRQLICPPLRLLTLVVVGQFLATLAAFLLSSASPDIEVRTSATRLFEQFLPLALYVGAVGLSRETDTYNRRGR